MAANPSDEQATLRLWRRLFSASLLSERAITLSTFVVAGGFLTSKILGYVRVALSARAFGTSGDMDAFLAASTFSDQLDSVIAGATIAAVFIPVFSSFMVKDKAEQEEGWRFASAVLNDMFLLMLVVAGVGILFAPQLVQYLVAPGFDVAQRDLATNLMRVVLLAAVVFAVSGTMTGILHAQNRFVLAAWQARYIPWGDFWDCGIGANDGYFRFGVGDCDWLAFAFGHSNPRFGAKRDALPCNDTRGAGEYARTFAAARSPCRHNEFGQCDAHIDEQSRVVCECGKY